MCWGVENILEGTEGGHSLSVKPALKKQVELGVGKHVYGRDSQQSEGQVKHPRKDPLEGGVPHTHSNGEVLAAVMNLVHCPQQHDF